MKFTKRFVASIATYMGFLFAWGNAGATVPFRPQSQSNRIMPMAGVFAGGEGDSSWDPWGSSQKTWGTFDQTLDPTKPSDHRTFKERYYVDSSWAGFGNPPVILYLCGESPCDESMMSIVSNLAQRFGGYLIGLEHRYFGQSQPFDQLTTDHLRYLTLENVLSDIARFEVYMQGKGYRGPWIVVGASYSGMLAAYYRETYPNLAFAAIASSAPVRHVTSFTGYDRNVARAVGPECASRMRDAMSGFERALKDPSEAQALRDAFSKSADTTPVDLLLNADLDEGYVVQFGFKDSFCYDLEHSQDALSVYRKYDQKIHDITVKYGAKDDPLVNSGMDLNAKDYEAREGGRAYDYLVSRYFGNYTIADPAFGVYSKEDSLETALNQFRKEFGTEPRTDFTAVNDKYYQPLFDPARASRILFTNGSNDPWSSLSITPDVLGNKNPLIKSYMLQGASHGQDLFGGPRSVTLNEQITQAREYTYKLISSWLSSAGR